jgi:hypothetical protein
LKEEQAENRGVREDAKIPTTSQMVEGIGEGQALTTEKS